MAFYGLDPWDGARLDMAAGIVAAMVANCHVDTKKRDHFTPAEFVPDWLADPDERDERLPGADDLAAKIKAFMAGLKPSPRTEPEA